MYALVKTYTMSTPTTSKPRQQKPKLTRMNLMVNRDDLRRLKEIYGVKSDSEAARKAHESAVLAYELLDLAEWTAARGGLRQPVPHEPLPHDWPDDEAGDEEP